jgi:hypothetical protein
MLGFYLSAYVSSCRVFVKVPMSAHAGFLSKCLCQLMLGFFLSAYVSSCWVFI